MTCQMQNPCPPDCCRNGCLPDECSLRKPQPPECKPCVGPRNPVCACDKQPKIIYSLIGYYRIHREKKDENDDSFQTECNKNLDQNDSSCDNNKDENNFYNGCCDIDGAGKDPYKHWPARKLFDECKEQRNYHLRFTTNGLYGRGYNNQYNVCSCCRYQVCCGNDCDLYGVCNDKY